MLIISCIEWKFMVLALKTTYYYWNCFKDVHLEMGYSVSLFNDTIAWFIFFIFKFIFTFVHLAVLGLNRGTWDLVPRPGIEPVPPVLATGPQGKSLGIFLSWILIQKTNSKNKYIIYSLKCMFHCTLTYVHILLYLQVFSYISNLIMAVWRIHVFQLHCQQLQLAPKCVKLWWTIKLALCFRVSPVWKYTLMSQLWWKENLLQ